MAKITFSMQPQKVQQLRLFEQSLFPHFSSLPEIEKEEEVGDVPQILTEQIFMATPENEMSYLTHALTTTSMIFDLGCARAMSSWRAASFVIRTLNVDFGIG